MEKLGIKRKSIISFKVAGLIVDELDGQQEIVIKSLGKYINNSSKIISGATVLGDGEVALILDVNTLF